MPNIFFFPIILLWTLEHPSCCRSCRTYLRSMIGGNVHRSGRQLTDVHRFLYKILLFVVGLRELYADQNSGDHWTMAFRYQTIAVRRCVQRVRLGPCEIHWRNDKGRSEWYRNLWWRSSVANITQHQRHEQTSCLVTKCSRGLISNMHSLTWIVSIFVFLEACLKRCLACITGMF